MTIKIMVKNHLDADFGIRVQIKRRRENIDLFLIHIVLLHLWEELRILLEMCTFHAPADGFFVHLALHLHTIAICIRICIRPHFWAFTQVTFYNKFIDTHNFFPHFAMNSVCILCVCCWFSSTAFILTGQWCTM